VEVTCAKNPSSCNGSPVYVEGCMSFVVGEVCLGAAGGTYGSSFFISAGPGVGDPGPSVAVGGTETGSVCNLIQGWSFSNGGDYGVGAGWANNSSAAGAYFIVAMPGVGAFDTHGWFLGGGGCG
jgi:hypothetical protein